MYFLDAPRRALGCVKDGFAFSVIRLLCDKNTSNAYYPARRPLSLEPDQPESVSLLGHGHLQLGQPSLRRGGLRVERWGETMGQRMEEGK